MTLCVTSLTSQWSPAFGAEKSSRVSARAVNTAEPSQWSPAFGAGKSDEALDTIAKYVDPSQWSPAFGAGKRPPGYHVPGLVDVSQWSPAFGAGKSGIFAVKYGLSSTGRNGAQLLELGKAVTREKRVSLAIWGRNGAQLLELGKAGCSPSRHDSHHGSQWSPAFGAGKRSH